MSSLLCLGRRTVTGLLSTSGQQFVDWSAAYRLFSKSRITTEALFTGVREQASALVPDNQPLCLALDDSLFRRTGTRIHGVAWRRDPLGPKFHTNFVRGQRFLQFSLAVPATAQGEAVRMIPIDFLHCPPVPKPGKKATDEELKQYRADCRVHSLTAQASLRLQTLCRSLRSASRADARPIHLLVDGQYTNGAIFKHLPPQTVLIGRIRKDAKLHFPPEPATGDQRGRRLLYGAQAPTPEQLRTDDAQPWQTIEVFACGVRHQMRIKILRDLLWRTAGPQLYLQLIVIAPLHYRLRAGSKLLYRQPAFLICTDPTLDPQQIVQQYVWRWDVEVNFREEKSLLGVGDAQVRTAPSTQSLPAFLIATYALLLLAGIVYCAQPGAAALPPPKWAARLKPQRTSTQRLLHHLRADVWARGIGLEANFSDFSSPSPAASASENPLPALASALLYSNA